MADRTELIAPCGLDCGVCELYLSRDNRQIREGLIAKGVSETVLPCDGCRAAEGACPVLPGTCATFACAERKRVRSCGECYEFPCTKLAPAADKASVLPHNMKMYNLCVIRARGAEALAEESAGIKRAYYQGTMRIGEGPRLDGQ